MACVGVELETKYTPALFEKFTGAIDMAKQTDNPTEVPATRPTARFQLKHPRAGWEGEVAGVKFVGGIGYTDSPMTAHGLMSRGIVPTDSLDKPEFRLDADALERIAKHAEEWPK